MKQGLEGNGQEFVFKPTTPKPGSFNGLLNIVSDRKSTDSDFQHLACITILNSIRTYAALGFQLNQIIIVDKLDMDNGLVFWIHNLLKSDEKIGQIMAENAFKLMYRLANDNLLEPTLYLKLARKSLDFYFHSANFTWEQADKLVAQIINQYTKKRHNLDLLNDWISELCKWDSMKQKERPSCLVWMDLALKVAWKSSNPAEPVFEVLLQTAEMKTVTLNTTVELMIDLEHYSKVSKHVEGILNVKNLSVYELFALEKLLKYVKSGVDAVWCNPPNEKLQLWDFSGIKLVLTRVIGLLDYVINVELGRRMQGYKSTTADSVHITCSVYFHHKGT